MAHHLHYTDLTAERERERGGEREMERGRKRLIEREGGRKGQVKRKRRRRDGCRVRNEQSEEN